MYFLGEYLYPWSISPRLWGQVIIFITNSSYFDFHLSQILNGNFNALFEVQKLLVIVIDVNLILKTIIELYKCTFIDIVFFSHRKIIFNFFNFEIVWKTWFSSLAYHTRFSGRIVSIFYFNWNIFLFTL